MVAKNPDENPKDFVKPLAESDVLPLWIGKAAPAACRWRIMCLANYGHGLMSRDWNPATHVKIT